MEEHNEYGNCWQDLVRRLDAEDRVANAKIKAWEEEEERREEGRIDDKDNNYNEVGSKNAGVIVNRGDKKGGRVVKKGYVKKETGMEMHKRIKEKREVRDVKKTKMEARTLVKQGRMKTIDSYFNKYSSDSD
jgi:hypothetical protein